MPDISKCKGTNCQLKFGCYRFKSVPNEPYQSYFTEVPVTNEGGVSQCGYFWPTEEFKKITDDREASRKELE